MRANTTAAAAATAAAAIATEANVMHTISEQLFLVNGKESRLTVEPNSIVWWPHVGQQQADKSCTTKVATTATETTAAATTVTAKHDNGKKDHQITEAAERLSFAQIIGSNHQKRPSKSRTDDERFKLYYAKDNEFRSTGQLLKIKSLTIESLRCANHTKSSSNTKGNSERQHDEQPAEAVSVGADASESHPQLGWPDLNEVRQVIEARLEQERQQTNRPRRLLIFVNPYGGKGKAVRLYKSKVRRLFALANVETKLVVTKHANHARDTIEDPMFNVEYFDAIICIGGDGMFSELMNGLLFRYNREKILAARPVIGRDTNAEHQQHQLSTASIDTDDQKTIESLRSALGGIGEPLISPPLPIGVIGAGSTDANSFGLIGTNDVITATLNIILGKQIQIDICSIHTVEEDRLLRFVSTFVAYGYFGDVVRESEKLRWLGPSRYDVTGVNNLIKNRAYHGRVRILATSQDGSPKDSRRCHVDCDLCKELKRPPMDSELEFIERQGSFVGVNAAVTACRCPQTKKGFSPNNHLANGCVDLILVRPCSRMQYVQYLLRTGWTKKSAFDLDYVESFRCRQFEFLSHHDTSSVDNHITARPLELSSNVSTSSSSAISSSSASNSNSLEMKTRTSNSSSPASMTDVGGRTLFSSWNVDGEIMNEASIRVKVNNRLLRVFGTGEPAPRATH